MSDPVFIPASVLDTIYEHANAAFPAECCGYLVGARSGERADGAVTCRNAQSDGDHPTHPDRGSDVGFVIAGSELFRFAKTFESERPALVVYHSHTNGRAYFSEVDRENAASPTGPHEGDPPPKEGSRLRTRRDHLASGPAYPVQHLVVGVTATGVTEAAQFAWSDEVRDFVEVARWAVDTRPPLV